MMLQSVLDELADLTPTEAEALKDMLICFTIRRTPYEYLICYAKDKTWCTIAKDPATLRRVMGFGCTY